MTTMTLAEPAGFQQLSKLEQIRYLQALWDRIAGAPGELPLPPEHLEILESRLAAHREHPERARSAYEVIDRLAKR
jgi:putative addiction module component (TIGR02574 family)